MTLAINVPTVIRKRSGETAQFDIGKIEAALTKCFAGMETEPGTPVDELARRIVNIVYARSTETDPPTVEQVQDIVEMVLQAAGEYVAAKRYILYRAEHERQRAARPIPEDVRAAFNASDQYFPTSLQKFQFFDKYSRFSYETGRRETWIETVDRCVDFLYELAGDRLERDTYEKIRAGILEMRAMPSMRLLAMAGEAARRNSVALYNCFTGDTRFVTDQGPRYLAAMVGESVNVLTVDGTYRPASIQSFGQQKVQEIVLEHWNGGKYGNAEHVVLATPDHRWLLMDGSETTSLKVGDRLIPSSLSSATPDPDAIRHGFVFGDGTLSKQNGVAYAQVRLCGAKAEAMAPYFEGFGRSYPPSYNGDPMVYCGRENAHWKRLPSSEVCTPSYIDGFIHGLALADGHRTDGGNLRIDTQDAALVGWLRDLAPLAGYKILSEHVYDGETNYGSRKAPLHQVMIGRGKTAILRVKSIVPDREAEVFCAVEPVTGTFTLANGQVTGNCSYQPVESIDSFVEALIISMAGCGVGYSVESKYVEELPRIKRQTNAKPDMLIVEDSSEGWADALRYGLERWMDGGDVLFNTSLIRPAGAPLRIKGGRASGPEPLEKMLDFMRRRILARQGSFLRPIDAHDMMCAVGSAAVSGGVRRTAMISLFDYDDREMLHCKSGDFERENSQRWNANNSAVWPEGGPTQMQFMRQFLDMVDSGRGEPGIFNREMAVNTRPSGRLAVEFGTNPCAEIILRPWEFCNLTSVVARKDDTLDTLAQKTVLATTIGTIQSLATTFPGLRRQWKQNCEDERLLGVDISGQLDSPAAQDPEIQHALRDIARGVNARIADALGINRSASITCVKPSGNSSQLLDCSSGIHARWAPYYIRNVRVSGTSALAKVLHDAGAPMAPENGDDPVNPRTWVVSFPVKSPEGAKTRNDRSAIEQCEYWLQNKLNWTEHNPSVTITYKPDEVMDVMKWVWEHRDKIGGMAFLPSFDAKYDQLPYIEISREEYERRLAEFPDIDFAKVYRYESDDRTAASQLPACDGPVCEIQE